MSYQTFYAADPAINTAIDVVSVLIVVVLVYVQHRTLTSEMFTAYWVMLAILHGRMLAFPVSLAAYRQGRAALGGL